MKELTQEQKIELIKFCCEYAEGFELISWESGHQHIDCPGYEHTGEVEEFLYTSLWNEAVYPLLLQRAIEGINRTDDMKIIQQDHEGVMVLSSDYTTIEKNYHFTELDKSITQSKEQALWFIYRQTKVRAI